MGLALAITANFFWALVNFIDKYLVERFCKESNIGSLLILSSLFPVTLIPVALTFNADPFSLTSSQIAVLILSGILTTAWMFFYFNALFDEDVSSVIALFQLTPVFALIFGFLILGELPSYPQLLFAGVILVGSLIISIEKSTGSIKYQLIAKLAAASAIIALMNSLFKYVALPDTFWTSILWHAVGTCVAGITLLFAHKTYRESFLTFIKENTKIGLGLNGLNEVLVLVGDVIFAYAVLLIPLVLAQSMEAYQPIFVFIIAVGIALFRPRWANGDILNENIVLKIVGILIIVFGSVLLALY